MFFTFCKGKSLPFFILQHPTDPLCSLQVEQILASLAQQTAVPLTWPHVPQAIKFSVFEEAVLQAQGPQAD